MTILYIYVYVLIMEKVANILSIDGGGIRGVVALTQLVEFEKVLHQPLYTKFDFISGTSTGGIIAVMLSIGYSAQEVLDFYKKHGETIFSKPPLRWGIFKPKYDETAFEEIIREYVGDKTLLDCKTDIIVPAYELNKIGTPNVLKLFKSHKAKRDPENYNYSLFDVIRSTSAAQTYFKPHKINSSYFSDGGTICNSPSMVTKYEAFDEGYNKLNIVSVACGRKMKGFDITDYDGGMLEWASPMVDALLDAQQTMTDYFLNKDKEMGLLRYVRFKSWIQYSDGSIDNASKDNMNRMILDGKFSAEKNYILMRQFYENTLTK